MEGISKKKLNYKKKFLTLVKLRKKKREAETPVKLTKVKTDKCVFKLSESAEPHLKKSAVKKSHSFSNGRSVQFVELPSTENAVGEVMEKQSHLNRPSTPFRASGRRPAADVNKRKCNSPKTNGYQGSEDNVFVTPTQDGPVKRSQQRRLFNIKDDLAAITSDTSFSPSTSEHVFTIPEGSSSYVSVPIPQPMEKISRYKRQALANDSSEENGHSEKRTKYKRQRGLQNLLTDNNESHILVQDDDDESADEDVDVLLNFCDKSSSDAHNSVVDSADISFADLARGKKCVDINPSDDVIDTDASLLDKLNGYADLNCSPTNTAETSSKPDDIISLSSNDSFIDEPPEPSHFVEVVQSLLELECNSSPPAICHKVDNGTIVELAEDSCAYFYGKAVATVLVGFVEIMGYKMSAASGSQHVYSPKGTSLLCVEARPRDSSEALCFDRLQTLEIDQQLIDTLSKSTSCAIVLFKDFQSKQLAFLEKYTPQTIFSKAGECIFEDLPTDNNLFQKSAQWDLLLENIDSKSRLMLCGGKGVGKSTLLRYIINRLVSTELNVAVIDLDPGQSEFTVSGCVSLTFITEPLLGPNYTHLKTPDRCFFVQHINMSHNPTEYLNSIRELMSYCTYRNVPTVINCMGLTRSLGLDVAASIIAYVQPTIVAEIRSASPQKNFSVSLERDTVAERCELFAEEGIESIPSYLYVQIGAMTDDAQGWTPHPRQLREMMIYCYFGGMVDDGSLSLTDGKVPVYCMDLSSVQLLNNGVVVDPMVANASLVALCTSSQSGTSYECFGWGIVRGIDLSTNTLYLLTPLVPEKLELVDKLIVGSAEIPPAFLMSRDDIVGHLPYVAERSLSTLGQVHKRSFMLYTKGNAGGPRTA